MLRWLFATILIFSYSLATAIAIDTEITFNEWPDYAAANNFAADDLLQNLQPDDVSGLWAAGTILESQFAGDAVSADDPGQAVPMPSSLVWTSTPSYLVYTLAQPCDISEIRISAVLSEGADDGTENRPAAMGDLALGVNNKSNPGGHPPVRPTENAIEVRFQGDTMWTPVVVGRVASDRRTMPQSFWQATVSFDAEPLRCVTQIKFTLDRTIEWSSGNYGQPTQISEIDVIGQPSQQGRHSEYTLISPSDCSIVYSGFVFPYSADTESLWFKWSGSGFRASFRSDHCRLRFNAPNNSKYWIKVDNNEFQQYDLTSIIDLTELLSSDCDEHQIEVVKKTEPDHGVELFLGLELDNDAQMQAVPTYDRRILFLGDSITVGMGAGLEGETDFLQTYGRNIANKFQADLRLVALSGVGVHFGWRNYTFMQEWAIVSKALTQAQASQPSLPCWQPDCIIINLSTNDASRSVETENVISAMRSLVALMRGQYPNAKIAVMVPWTYGCYREPINNLIADMSSNGIWGISCVDAEPATWIPEDGMRDNTHPNFRGQAFAADLLAQHISDIMNWPLDESE